MNVGQSKFFQPVTAAGFMLSDWISKVAVGTVVCVYACMFMCVCNYHTCCEAELIKCYPGS